MQPAVSMTGERYALKGFPGPAVAGGGYRLSQICIRFRDRMV